MAEGKFLIFLGLLFAAMAVMTLSIVKRQENHRNLVLENPQSAFARVVDVQKFYKTTGSGVEYKVYVRYTTANGNEIGRIEASPFPNGGKGAKIGQQIKIVYNKEVPTKFYVDYKNKGGMLTFWIMVGVSFICFCIYIRLKILSEKNK